MECLIKQIPSNPYGTPGNNGTGFPLTGLNPSVPSDENCYIVLEENSNIFLSLEQNEEPLLWC